MLRLDYKPNRLFRYNGNRWVKIEDAVRTNTTGGQGDTQKDRFINNSNTYVDAQGVTRKNKQLLSDALSPEADE